MTCGCDLLLWPFKAVGGYFRKQMSFQDMANMNALPPNLQSHLMKVYLVQALLVASMVFGFQAHIHWAIGGLITLLMFIGSLTWCCLTAPQKGVTKAWALIVAAFFLGATSGPLTDKLNCRDIINETLGLATLVFCHFTAGAISPINRTSLYFYASLLSVPEMWNWRIFPSGIKCDDYKKNMFNKWYPGIICTVLTLYVVAYSQEMVAQALVHSQDKAKQAPNRPDFDYSKDALKLFIDFPAVLCHSVIILMRRLFCGGDGMPPLTEEG